MPLLERESELRTLSAGWRQVVAGGPGTFVLVGGESGIGKTWLTASFAREHVPDEQLLWGICDPLTTPRPLGPLHDVSDRLPPAVRAAMMSAGHGYQVFQEVHRALCASSYLLVVDDLQWADEASLELLRFLLRRIDRTRSLVLVTYRDDEVGDDHPLLPLLGDAARSSSATTLQPKPLTPAGVAAMLTDSELDAGHVHRATRGNCFFVAEVASGSGGVSAGHRQGRGRHSYPAPHGRTAQRPDAAGGRPGDHLRPGAARARRGPADAQGVLPVRPHRAEPPRAAVPSRAGAARHRGDDPSGRARDAAPATPGRPRGRRRIRPRSAHHHAVAAADDARVRTYASRAGVLAPRSSSHVTAAEFFRMALDRSSSAPPPQRAELLELLSVELYLADRLDEAIHACAAAAALRESDGDRERAAADAGLLALYEWFNADRPNAERHAASAVG